jgi:hypothetical protein
MKRLFVGLVLLLASFLSALAPLEGLRLLAGRLGPVRWIPDLVIALVVVALFARLSQLNRRMLFPRRGVRLLAAGIAMYVLAVAAASGGLGYALGVLPAEAATPLGSAPELAARIAPLPIFVIAQVLLALGAFRALTNLVPPGEFAEDF